MRAHKFTGEAVACGSAYSTRDVASELAWGAIIDKAIADAGGVGKKHLCSKCGGEIVNRHHRAELCLTCLAERKAAWAERSRLSERARRARVKAMREVV